MEQSTRLSIVEHALADVVERLADLPATQDAESLRALARQYVLEVERWGAQPPEEGRRVDLLRRVLDLNVDVIRAGARPSGSPPDADNEEEYLKPI